MVVVEGCISSGYSSPFMFFKIEFNMNKEGWIWIWKGMGYDKIREDGEGVVCVYVCGVCVKRERFGWVGERDERGGG